MHGLVLAGGEGSRLAAAGVTLPKPLVEVAGKPQVARLLDTLDALGCETLTCVVNAGFPAVGRLLATLRFRAPLHMLECRTPSSLHTLVAGLAVVPPGPVFCTMVDTVMRVEDWQAVHGAMQRHLAAGADLSLAVTPYVDDESPVYVGRSGGGDSEVVRVVSDEPVLPLCVTGGVYGLSVTARRAAATAVRDGVHRMRGFIRVMVAEGGGGRRVSAVEVPRIIDIDRPFQLQTANAWLASREA